MHVDIDLTCCNHIPSIKWRGLCRATQLTVVWNLLSHLLLYHVLAKGTLTPFLPLIMVLMLLTVTVKMDPQATVAQSVVYVLQRQVTFVNIHWMKRKDEKRKGKGEVKVG